MIDETEVIRLYTEELLACAQVAKHFGTYPMRINRILKKHGIVTRKKWMRPLRRCTFCKERKPLSEFGTNRKESGGRGYVCKPCAAKYKRERWTHLTAYGITKEDYARMSDEQGGVCAICKQPVTANNSKDRMCVDHDHITGKVRGLLCGKCNSQLNVLDTNPGWFISAIKYLSQSV